MNAFKVVSHNEVKSDLAELLNQLWLEEEALRVHKSRIDQLRQEVLKEVSFDEGKKSGKVYAGEFVAKIQKRFERVWNENKLAETIEGVPALKEFFKVKYVPVSNLDIEKKLQYSSKSDEIRSALEWATSEVREYNSIKVERLADGVE